MTVASKITTCTSCGDTIAVGQRLTVLPSTKSNSKDLLCFRCHSDTETAKIRVTIPSNQLQTSQPKRVWLQTR